ncbi:YqiA/YcfP family alpha/beta fold hydrolase [Spongiibacter tropicus]|uniref:YqiA/YcfP family alpha/beta fold hydrolase n=1 Tax=Spongiibacter tropicus TaxID=454602 RepID=UPI002356B78A|nr:YqiA/YcfP family alpha/beta fold hydrolase [Spongiibacter tropicus]|tara:strand:- start:3726 stop:4313 length:588 start_codon:yes stop_codon:yes gene_type:complete
MSATVIYIHGFLSSPQSHKAQLAADYFKRHHPDIRFLVPDMPNHPAGAFARLDQLVKDELARQPDKLVLMGSSLGGFFSTVLAERYDLKAVVVNPAVRPHERGEQFLGDYHNPYTHEPFSVTQNDIHCLAELTPAQITPQRYWLMVQEGDETLDYRLAVDAYAGSKQLVEPGGDHSFVGFERHLPAIVEFLGVAG